MGEKQGKLWDKIYRWLFWISSLTSISTTRLSTKITSRDFPPQTSTPNSNRDTLSSKDSLSHYLQHHHTCSTLSSLQHTLQSTTLYTDCLNYLRCLLSGATIDTALEQNFWSGSQHQDRYLYHLAQSHRPHAQGKSLSLFKALRWLQL